MRVQLFIFLIVLCNAENIEDHLRSSGLRRNLDKSGLSEFSNIYKIRPKDCKNEFTCNNIDVKKYANLNLTQINEIISNEAIISEYKNIYCLPNDVSCRGCSDYTNECIKIVLTHGIIKNMILRDSYISSSILINCSVIDYTMIKNSLLIDCTFDLTTRDSNSNIYTSTKIEEMTFLYVSLVCTLIVIIIICIMCEKN